MFRPERFSVGMRVAKVTVVLEREQVEDNLLRMKQTVIRVPCVIPAVLLLFSSGCGQWQRVGMETAPDPSVVVPRLFDPLTTYRGMGMLVSGDPLPFVASVKFLAGPTADSTFAVFGVYLTNNALTFRRSGDYFEARYRVEATFEQEGRRVGRVAEDQRVRVAEFSDTQRHDESVIFQQVLKLPPGQSSVNVVVRDQRRRESGQAGGDLEVPRYDGGAALSSIVAVYRSLPRRRRADVPQLVVNPRAAMPYQSDTLYLYFEAYGLPRAAQSRGVIRATDQANNEVWRDTLVFDDVGPVAATQVAIAPDELPVGELRFEATLPATGVTASAKALISFSDQWAVGNFEEVLSLLRYFGQDRAIRGMRAAPVAQRARLWREFWEGTDPNPMTSEHEDLDEYFQRLSQANELFREPGTPGWLTDRGEVVVTLGAPDEIYDSSSDVQSREGFRIIRWNYIAERLTVDFVDDTGFGRFRLTPSSRADYQRILNRIRRSE